MTCPKCHGEMRVYERSGVTVDQCTECRGIFLDRGELEKLFEAEANFNSRQAAAPPRPQQQQPGGYAPPPPPPGGGYARRRPTASPRPAIRRPPRPTVSRAMPSLVITGTTGSGVTTATTTTSGVRASSASSSTDLESRRRAEWAARSAAPWRQRSWSPASYDPAPRGRRSAPASWAVGTGCHRDRAERQVAGHEVIQRLRRGPRPMGELDEDALARVHATA